MLLRARLVTKFNVARHVSVCMWVCVICGRLMQ
jgi:hypothetical protein